MMVMANLRKNTHYFNDSSTYYILRNAPGAAPLVLFYWYKHNQGQGIQRNHLHMTFFTSYT